MIRAAKFADITAIWALLQESYEASVYKPYGVMDERMAKGMLMNAMQLMGHKKGNAVFFQVIVNGFDVIVGFFMGSVQPVYLVGEMLSASDIFFVAEKAPTRERLQLLDNFIAWAEANPRVVEIKPSTSDAMMPNWRDLRPIYLRRGFERAGDVFVRRI